MKYKSPRAAIKAHCIGCIYDPAEQGHKLEQVENCKIVQCELYEYRPMSTKTKKLARRALSDINDTVTGDTND